MFAYNDLSKNTLKFFKANKLFILAILLWLAMGLFYPNFVNTTKQKNIIQSLNATPEHTFLITKTPTKSNTSFGSSYYVVGKVDGKYDASGFINTKDEYIINEVLIIKAHFVLNNRGPADENFVKFSSATVVNILQPVGLKKFLINTHKQLLNKCAALSNRDAGALLCGIVMGDRSLFTDSFDQDMKNISLTHITAVSGMHISILLAFVLGFLGLLGLPKIWKIIISGLVLFIFMSFVGFSPSVLRAGVMGAIMLFAVLLGHKKNSLRALSIAIIFLILHNVYITRQIAFALSVISTFAIIKIAPLFQKFLSKHLPGQVAEIISIPLVAQLFCAPVIVLFSGQISIIGVIANILLIPLVPVIMILGMIPLNICFYASAFGCTIIVGATKYLSAVPFSHLQLFDGFKASISVLFITMLLLFVLAKFLKKRSRFNKFVICLITVLAIFILPTPVQSNFNSKNILTNYQVVFCDVGQGNGSIVSLGNGDAVLIDAGPADGNIDKCAQNAGVKKFTVAIFTHLHSDHISGLPLLKKYNIRNIITNNFCHASEGIKVLNDYSNNKNVVQINSADGIKSFVLANKKFTIFPSDVDRKCNAEVSDSNTADGTLVNDAGISILVQDNDINYWFLGDLETEGQNSLLEKIKNCASTELCSGVGADNNRQTVVLIPHHGSSKQVPELAAYLHPNLTIISVGKDNSYGHPSKTAIETYQNIGSKIARTDICGTVSTKQENGTIISSCVN